MKYLIIIWILSSCATLKNNREYKAYQRVAGDAFVDQREGVLLSQKCLTVYPAIRDTPRVVSGGVDSAEYNATTQAYNELIDSMIVLYDRMDGMVILDSTATLPVDYIIRPQDSLRILRNFLRIYRPPPIVQYKVTEVPTINTAWQAMKQTEIEHCRAEKATLQMNNDILSAKLQKKNSKTGWIIAIGLMLAVVSFFVGKIKF